MYKKFENSDISNYKVAIYTVISLSHIIVILLHHIK